MNNELKISAKEARAAYNHTDAAGKELLENLFGKETFAPKDITERVKTLVDAIMNLGEDHKVVKEYRMIERCKRYIFSENCAEAILAFAKLRVIAAALNEGWRPTYSSEEPRYYPWFFYLSRKQYAALNDDIKKSYSVVESITGGYPYAIGCGEIASSMTLIACGPPLIFKTERLAVYCGKQFIDIWADFLFA